MEVDSTQAETSAKGEQVEHADLVIAMLSEFDAEGIVQLSDRLRELPGPMRVLVGVKDVGAAAPELITKNSEAASRVAFVAWPTLGLDLTGPPLPTISAGYQSIFTTSLRLEARACCIVASKLENATPEWIAGFLEPLLDGEFDLVTPSYAHHKLEGLLNSSIVSPLTRSLYGRRVSNPMGPDLGVSQRLFQKILGNLGGGPNQRRNHPLASLAPVAACEKFKVCQVHLGARTHPPTDWTNISSLLVDVLGPVFLDMERNAACWQRVRGSNPVATFGEQSLGSDQVGAVDVERLVNSFQLGARDLQEIWSLVLPPASLLELRKLARLTADRFQMSDQLWVRVIYDFALAHRLRTLNRDHLLRSMTPIYLGWVASHARAIANVDGEAANDRLEHLSVTYELEKSYLVSRWRWPDRFHP